MSVQGSPSKYNKKPLKSKSHKIDIIDWDNETNVKNNGICWANFQDFSSSTSLHGIQYLGESKRSLLERMWWLIMIILSITGCAFMIYKIWKKWEISPVIVSFAETSMPVWQIPFPAVTICSQMKIMQSKYNYTEAYYNKVEYNESDLSDDEIFVMESTSLLCDENLRTNGSEFANKTTLDYLKSVSHQNHEIFQYCEWTNIEKPCHEIFSTIFTDEGYCFSFNILSGAELFEKNMSNNGLNIEHGNKSTGWTIDDGYPKSVSEQAYPERGISGVLGGLSVILKSDIKDADYLCASTPHGFKISLHSPVDFPRVSRNHFVLPVESEMVVAIKPDMLTTSDGLEAYDPHRRNCYRDSERKLKLFQIYTQQNCQLECLSNYTQEVCGCVAFWMPSDENFKICSSGKVDCVDEAQDDLEKYEIKYAIAIQNGDKEKIRKMKSISCDCLPGCTSINYEVETSQSDFQWQELVKARRNKDYYNTTQQFTIIRFFFKNSDFITSRRSELYGITDFLANCGGILGLFLGFSFLSLAEIFYFLTIGPMFNLKRRFAVARGNFRKSWKQRRHLSTTN